MADHQLVEQVLVWLGNWSSPPAQPTLIDRDDSESSSFSGRKVGFDLTDNHAASVASTPDRVTTPIGTEYDHRVEDAVNVRLEGAHTDQFGTISDAVSWQDIIDEAERVILDERDSYPTVNGVDYHTVEIDNASNLSATAKDYFGYEFDVVFTGYDELP
jgi:hypothetical protein